MMFQPNHQNMKVNWDDDSNPIFMGKCQIDVPTSHHQPVQPSDAMFAGSGDPTTIGGGLF